MVEEMTADILFAIIVAVGFSLTALYVAIARRHKPTWIAGVVMLLACAELSLAHALESISADFATKVFWYKMIYLGFSISPTAFLCLALRYGGLGRVLTLRTWLLLSVLPALNAGLVFTNENHGWVWNPASTALIVSGNGFLSVADARIGYWFIIAYSYFVMGLGCLLLVHNLVRSRGIYSWQAGGVAIACMAAFLGSALDIFGVSPLKPFAATMLGLAGGSITVAFMLSFLRRRDILTVSRGAIIRSISDAIVVVDEGDRIADINPAAARLIGAPAAQAMGRPLEEFLPELKSLGNSSAQKSYEVELHRENTPRTFDLRVSAVQDWQDHLISRILVLRDITVRKQMEEALRESEERYTLAVQGSNDSLWDWDLSKNEIYYSPRWKSMFGYAEDQSVNSPDAWFGLVHPEDLARVKEEISSHLRGTTPYLQSEHRIHHKNGSNLWVLARGLAVRDENGTAYRMAGSFSDITAHKRAEEQLSYSAFHDALTGLPNRSLFIDRLEHAIERTHRRNEYKFAILYLDLDRFKLINDSLGHMIGDQLLIAGTQRLRSCVRALDTVARFGGDEFVILLDDIENANDAISTAERIQNQLAQPFEVDGHRMFISASVGIVLNSAEYASPEEILRDADIAMYRAKFLGRARYAIFDTGMRDQAFARVEIEADLRGAIERQEFRVYYQPIVALDDGGLVGFEALIRWQHPSRGLLSPAEFIWVAEETGLIIPIGKWVIREACRQMRDWQTRFADKPPMTIHVNLSAKQFNHPNLTGEIKQALQETGLGPSSLTLEITESVLMENSRVAVDVLKELQAFGVRVELDDFGTGYSSLNYLHQFPITGLKIDRTFVKRIEDSGNSPEIVQTIVKLGHDLGMKVVAEGLETSVQLEHLKTLGCDYAQGYYFAKPLEAKAIEDFVKESPMTKILVR